MQHSTSWLNCSNAYRRDLLKTAARGPTEAEARAAKVQREADRRRAQASGQVVTYDPRNVVITFDGKPITGIVGSIEFSHGE